MVRSLGFGSIRYYNIRPIQPRFHYASVKWLRLQQQITRWIVLQKARCHRINLLQLLVRTQFQDLFHSPSGVLLTFPSRYLFTIDRKIYLALEGGPPRFSQDFTCPDLLNNTNNKVCDTWHTRLSRSLANLSRLFCSPRKFLTLRRLVIASASNTKVWINPELRTGNLYVTTL